MSAYSGARGREYAPPPTLKSFRLEEDTLTAADKIARLEARVAVLERDNAQLAATCEEHQVRVQLLKRFCRYHAIKLKLEDELERETNTDQALGIMRAEMRGLSLDVGAHTHADAGESVGGGEVASTIAGAAASPRTGQTTLRVRFDRRVHGGGDGVENRFSYGSASISQHKYMGPADGVASPRRATGHGGGDGSGTDAIGVNNNNTGQQDGGGRFRMRRDRTLHGVPNEEAVLMLGSEAYQERLRKQSKDARRPGRDARRRKIRDRNNDAGLDIFGAKQHTAAPLSARKQSEADSLDQSLFAGMLNPKAPGAGPVDHERHGTDLRAETQLSHRALYRGPRPQRNEISAFAQRKF